MKLEQNNISKQINNYKIIYKKNQLIGSANKLSKYLIKSPQEACELESDFSSFFHLFNPCQR